MSTKTTFDVRTEQASEIGKIVFANEDSAEGYTQAQYLNCADDCVMIQDAEDHVAIYGKKHALNLIKALEKAIELKWLV